MSAKLVPASFVVPERLETDRLRIRPLTVNDVIKDYDAVMTSVEHLATAFGPGSDWPSPTLTLEQDLIDLGWHQKEFQQRSSFAYTVVSLDESRCLGCLYLFPSRKPGFDAVAICWVRASELAGGLDAHLFETLKRWLAADWPFRNVAFPGREIPWEEWRAGDEPA